MAKSSKTFRFGSMSEAFALIQDKSSVVTAMAAAEPQLFWRHGHQRLKDLSGVRIFCANPSQAWPLIADDTMRDHTEIIVMFMTGVMRKLQGRGFVHYMPQHLSQWSRNLRDKDSGVDVFWGTCSAPDARGFVSLGTSNCYESEILRAAKYVVLEVNPRMPPTFGATEVALDEVDLFLECEGSLPEIQPAAFGDIEGRIADYVVDLIPDGATLQLGIGGIPNAVGKRLVHKRDLGVHTEMINDAFMDLYNCGVVTGRQKLIWPRKIVGAFAYGSAALYDFIRQNPVVEFHPASVVNDPYRIGRNHKMISMNTAVEVDLTGQVCSESVGHSELSGVGGAAETHIGAQRSHGGRGIVAIPSTAKNGTVSKITVALQPGAKVSISRNDIDTVVTEHGVAVLKGKTVPERIREMVRVAHPAFRDQLLAEAKRLAYI
jgi:acyl-CoA hydrolase